MVDRYSKIVLTVIALALVALVVRPMFESGSAGAQARGCGDAMNPCYVTAAAGGLPVRGTVFVVAPRGGGALPVYVTNWP